MQIKCPVCNHVFQTESVTIPIDPDLTPDEITCRLVWGEPSIGQCFHCGDTQTKGYWMATCTFKCMKCIKKGAFKHYAAPNAYF